MPTPRGDQPVESPAPAAYPSSRSHDDADRLGSLAGRADLRALAAESVRVTAGLIRVAAGRSPVQPAPRDRRFADPAFEENPVYRRWAQAYLVWAQSVERMASSTPLQEDWRRGMRIRAAAERVVAAAAPSNLLIGNPAALKRAFDTGGTSLLRGSRNATRDLVRHGGLPARVDRGPFRVGENLAATPGAVIHRDEQFELLEYRPATPRVRRHPLLMIPPQVNKHYFLDLAPGRSLTEYLVSRGIHYFTVVWRNPRPEHGGWGIDDYVGAQLRAIDVMREVSGSERYGLLGACAGGLTTGLMLGYLVAKGAADAVSSATFAISMIDSSLPNPMSALASERALRAVAADARRGKVYPADEIARAFAWMRPNDLVFNYMVRNWLLGESPPAFDILAWNDDASNLPARFYAEMLEIYAGNRAAEPGAVQVLGTPVDLSSYTGDAFVTAGMTDHITPWKPGYMTTQVLGGRSEVVVTSTGHIQTMVNPPGKPRARYFAGPEPGPDPRAWLAAATEHEGSWWPRYADWLIARSGEERAAPAEPGSAAHPPLGPAPGSYVRE